MKNKTLLMGLLTETSLHAGVGQALDVVDLPIQREAHTGYPCVFGSAVKGALRTLANDTFKDDKGNVNTSEVNPLFGDEGSEGKGSEYAGALLITDARLLLLPVRSLTSHFKWVTCPAILKRLLTDCARLGLDAPFSELQNKITDEQAISNDGDILFLEEFRFNVIEHDLDLSSIIEFIVKLMGRDDAEDALKNQLVIVNDDIFSQLSQYATPVNAHIKMKDDSSKTVQDGGLWYEETLPPDTLLYVGVVANRARQKEINKTPNDVLDKFKELLPKSRPYLQLGGNETLGMGWCKVSFYEKCVSTP